jgi:protein-tyrosine phosphatase
MDERHLNWDGCFNVRDLGGMRTSAGGETRWGGIVRGDAPDGLTDAGWEALLGHGVRTIVDLRNDDELARDGAPRPDETTTLHVALDAIDDREFWDDWEHGPQFATPMYYGPHFEHFPDRSAAVIKAIAGAGDGGVYVHCIGGRDRTGQMAILLLSLAGVDPEEIVADYELSGERLVERYAALGEPDQGPELAAFLAREGTSARELILSTLDSLDAESYVRSAGVSDEELAAVRARLVGDREV